MISHSLRYSPSVQLTIHTHTLTHALFTQQGICIFATSNRTPAELVTEGRTEGESGKGNERGGTGKRKKKTRKKEKKKLQFAFVSRVGGGVDCQSIKSCLHYRNLCIPPPLTVTRKKLLYIFMRYLYILGTAITSSWFALRLYGIKLGPAWVDQAEG